MHTLHTHARHCLSAALTLLGLVILGSNAAQAAPERPSISNLQAQIATLQSQVATGTIPNVSSYVTMDVSTPSRPTLRVTGANLQVVNGQGTTENTVNGLGNVIVGYDEMVPTGNELFSAVCSHGQYTTQPTCTAGGGTWALDHKSGSHNLVVGAYHRYSRFSGIITGGSNTINGDRAFVTGDSFNTASGAGSSVSGGASNTASGLYASVSGGLQNTASGYLATVSGGGGNLASGNRSSVSGGDSNTASGLLASVSGGQLGQATGGAASVSGGLYGVASGGGASVSGGQGGTASQNWASVGGGLNNVASGQYASVSGGSGRTVSIATFWVGGNSLSPQ